MITKVRVQILKSDKDCFDFRFCKDPINGIQNSDYTIIRNIFKAAGGNEICNASTPVKPEIYDEYEDGRYYFWVVIYSLGHFLGGQRNAKGAEIPFSQNLLLADSIKPQNSNEPDRKLIPILHLIPTNIFLDSLYGSAPLSPFVPRYFQIMDSSIWNYFGFLFNVTYDYEEHGKVELNWGLLLRKAIKSICTNYEKRLYSLSVTKEYADLNARLVDESLLSGSHASGVSPFIFHSESVMKHLIEKEFVKDNHTIERIKNQKWRILLVDDKAAAPMENDKDEKEQERFSWNCKLTIIKQLLEKQFGLKDKNNPNLDIAIPYKHFIPTKFANNSADKQLTEKGTPFIIEFAETEKEAEEALKLKKYDIVLLDYLLKDDSGNHYGYELLENISKHVKDDTYKLGKGPNGKFFFLFISAYSSAIYERLLAEGLNQNEDYWQIAIGSCPTNTPQLFLYNLIKLMENRLEHTGIEKLLTKNIYNLVDSIFNPKEGSVRKSANNKYQEVLSLQYHYRKMLQDVDIPEGNSVFDTTGSVLVTNFILKNVNLGGMLEHLTQLVHLTAFGTIRQWPEMWEEYIYFKGQFKAQNTIAESEAISEEKFQYLMSHIEDYIKTLKTQ